MVNVCCVYYGHKYETIYVQNLYNMVKRHLTKPFKFYCFTDHTKIHKIVKGDIIFKSFPRHDFEGWWHKLQLFNPDTGLQGVNFYMDLDVVITKNIDCFVEHGNEMEFGIIRDFGQPQNTYNSSVMKWNNAIMSDVIWKPYMSERINHRKLQGDQNVITHYVQGKKILKPFPDEWTQSYKWLNRKGERYAKDRMTYEQDLNAKVCVFHGRPNPHESTELWVKNLWY